MSSFAHNTLAAAHSEETSQSTRSSRHLGKVLVDTSTEYRAFLFAVHPQHGFLLLKCRDKKNKGSYWEIPGGHLDDEDFEQAADQVFVKPQQLDLAGKIGVARELFEESGIDIRGEVERLESAVLGSSENNSGAYASLQHLYKDRLFYFLRLEDTDFLPAGVVASGSEGLDLQIQLSEEHVHWQFVKELELAIDLLQSYSGGKVSDFLAKCARAEVSDEATQEFLRRGFDETSSTKEAPAATQVIDNRSNETVDVVPFEFDDSSSTTTIVDIKSEDEVDSQTAKVTKIQCDVISECQSEPCVDTEMEACQLTGYVEQVVCEQSSEGETQPDVKSFRGCTLSSPHVVDLGGQNTLVLVPLLVCVCLVLVCLFCRRSQARPKWKLHMSRYHDDDAYDSVIGALDRVDETYPLDLPPVD